MIIPSTDQITLSVDIAHLRVSGFILHAGARDRQRSARKPDRVKPLTDPASDAHAGADPSSEE